jgi:hypothetical protein
MNEDILNQLGTPEEVPSEEPTEELKVEDKKKSSGKQIDEDILASLIANGDNTKGMFEPDESEVKEKDEKLHEEPDEDAKLKTKGKAKPSDKYATEFQKDMIKNPENYYINTPKGKMTIKEAQEKGYDPTTRRFTLKKNTKKEEELLSQLNDKDRAAVEKMMDPSQVGLAPADAQAMGLKPDSKMIRQGNPMEQPPAQAPTPMPLPAAGPDAMTGQAPSGGDPDINALLGGNV